MIALRHGWRFLRRDLPAGEVRVLLAALVLSVMAVTAVGFLTDRAERSLSLEANRLLGGDAMLRADELIGEAPRERLRLLGELRILDDLTRQTDRNRPLRRDPVAEHQQLGGVPEPDDAREQVGGAHVRAGQAHARIGLGEPERMRVRDELS